MAALDLPEGAVSQHSVLVVAYFNAEGETCYGIVTSGDAALSSALGLLELAKANLLAETADEWGGQE